MQQQDPISVISTADFSRVIEVWEASVRATHHFLSEADIHFFKPLVLNGLSQMTHLDGVRNHQGDVIGFIGVVEDKIEMLFISPSCRGQGFGRQLIEHVVKLLGATKVDVNEQNEQAVGFYQRMGFEIEGRSEVDGMGKPFPLLHLRLSVR